MYKYSGHVIVQQHLEYLSGLQCFVLQLISASSGEKDEAEGNNCPLRTPAGPSFALVGQHAAM